MLTFLQIAIILLLMALVGMLVGYLFGQFSCKRVSKDTMIKKGGYCEGEYAQKHNLNAQTDHSELEQLKDTFEQSNSDELNSVATPLMKKEDTLKEERSKVEDEKESSELEEENKLSNEVQKEDIEVENREDSQELIDDNADTKKENSNIIKDNAQSNNNDIDNKSVEEDTNEDSLQEDIKENVQLQDNNQEENLDEDSNKKESEEEYKPQFLSEPKDGKEDNLCEIKGIGTVIDKKLKELGIYHFEQIAQWTQKDIAWIDEYLAFKGRVERENWIGQAKLLAEGKETEFSKRVKKGEVASSKKD